MRKNSTGPGFYQGVFLHQSQINKPFSLQQLALANALFSRPIA